MSNLGLKTNFQLRLTENLTYVGSNTIENKDKGAFKGLGRRWFSDSWKSDLGRVNCNCIESQTWLGTVRVNPLTIVHTYICEGILKWFRSSGNTKITKSVGGGGGSMYKQGVALCGDNGDPQKSILLSWQEKKSSVLMVDCFLVHPTPFSRPRA